MKKTKFGFTLAEILITLSIVGVVAALIIPQLVDNTRKSQYGAALGRAIMQIELGIENIKQKANSSYTDGSITNDLSAIDYTDLYTNAEPTNDDHCLTNSFFLFEYGAAFFGVNEMGQAETEDYYEITDTNFSYGGVHLFKFNKSNTYIMYAAQKNSSYSDIYTVLAIDVNGPSKPNRKGKDIFAFGLTESGKLVPAGTARFNEYSTNITDNDLGVVPVAEEGCKDGNITNGWSCTARVVSNGFRIDY